MLGKGGDGGLVSTIEEVHGVHGEKSSKFKLHGFLV